LNEYNIQKAKDTIAKLTIEVDSQKDRYEEAGRIYQDADRERANAEQELAVA
jgi:FtsZ-binding cell division protein ZapB